MGFVKARHFARSLAPHNYVVYNIFVLNISGGTVTHDHQDTMRLANQLCFPLYAAARNVTRLYTPWLKPLGLTYTQYLVFLVLWEKDGISVTEIGNRLMLDNGTLSPLLKKMEQA
ncbi:MAG: MarR family transcriptional regulator, partial [Atopobiaceae bacterium]|nr:MarR family transcriptional regulator [Atopobiaceae bacterium]